MGSWSIYCGVSKIAITAGQSCVLLPLKENKHFQGYHTHLPATFPIFGEYDDYGGLENIENDENTKLIESHFGVKIKDFAHYFTRGVHCPDETKKSLRDNEEMEDWEFMFIDRKVYDFMSTNIVFNGSRLDFGNPTVLELLGFKEEGDSGVPRYTKKYSLGGKSLYSDGTWIEVPGSKYGVYSFKDFLKHFKVAKENLWVGAKTMVELFDYLGDDYLLSNYGSIIGIDRNFALLKRLMEYAEKDYISGNLEMIKTLNPNPDYIQNKYANSIREFSKQLSALNIFAANLHPMSGNFDPYIPYLTPQCGEIDAHQILLNKFAKINKEYIQEQKRLEAEFED